MRLEQAQHLLVGGYLLALQHANTGLGNDTLDQWQHLLSFCAQSLRLLLSLLAQGLDDTLGLPHHLLRRLDELLIQHALLLDLFLRLAREPAGAALGPHDGRCAADCGRPPVRS